MMQKFVLIGSLSSLILIAMLAWLVYQASPGPASQAILGVGLGQYESEQGVAFLSGKRLTCTPIDSPPFTTTCSVSIADQLLTIEAYRNGRSHPNQLGGGCRATYADREWACQIGNRHVHVGWFAYINEPLGLTTDQLDGLRRRYFFDNLPEEPFLTGMLVVPVLVAFLMLAAFVAWHQSLAKRPLGKRIWAMAAGLSLFAFVSSFWLAFNLTSNFWD